MPIKIPNDLPAFEKLQQEGVQLIGEDEALRQDVRPMQVALLNLMPEKPKTETQLARLLGATPLQVELTLLTTCTYRPNTVPLSHLQAFYQTWDEVRDRKFDGLIITGAPVEMLPFEEVKYWQELTEILDWSRTHVHCCFHICWGAQAALYHFHGVPKHALPTKRFGIFTHHVIEQRDAAPAAADARLRRLFPGPGLPPHRSPRRRPAARVPASKCWPRRMPRACACCTSRRTAPSTCSTISNTTPSRCTTSTCRDLASAATSRCRSTTTPTTIRRSAAQLLAGLRPPAVRQLDQRDVPDHALRAGADRHGRGGEGRLTASVSPRVVPIAPADHLDDLAAILVDAVEGGASVSFMLPFTLDEARALWRRVAERAQAGEVVTFGAFTDHRLDGTVQLITATPPNQPHRAEIAKLLVHRRARGRDSAGR